MKKKLFAILLSLVMILSSVSILSEVSFAGGEKTFVLKKADGTELGQYDNINNDIIKKMNDTDSSGNYIIEVTKDYEFEGASRTVVGGLNITFTSKEGRSPVLTSGNGMPHFLLQNGNYTFKNIILEGKSGSTGGGIYTHDDNQGVTITLDSGTVIRNCNYIDAPYYYRPIVIRDKYLNDGKDSVLIINEGVTIEGCKTNTSDAGCAISVRDKCKLIVNGGTFKNNDAQNARFGGGVIFNDEEAETIINGGTFEGNKAAGYGGAIINYGKLTINSGTFKDNEASNGGAISSIKGNPELIVNGGTFENNKSIDKWGGAIVAKNKVSIKKATFENNYSGNGGAVYAYYANNSIFENCTFKDNGVDNEKSVKQGGALFVNSCTGVSIKNNTFTKNTAQVGGALIVSNVEGSVEENTFKENFAEGFSSAFHVKNSAPSIKNNTYKNNGKKDDKATAYATLMIESIKAGEELTIEGDKFESNFASKAGGAIVTQDGIVKLKSCEFTNNKVPEYGGAIYITDDGKVNIESSKFIGNTAKRGGAIVTELFSQANPAEENKYANLKISGDVEFDKNFASDGYFNPPTNYKDFPDLKFKTTSLMGKLHAIKDIDNDLKTYEKVDSVLNNYDVYYVNPLITVTYDSNGGTPEEKIVGEELKSEDDELKPAEHKVKTLEETGLKKDGSTFKEWNTKADGTGTSYKAGSTINTSSNVILYAIWDAPTPAPKPTEPSTVILTLDENYRSGEITNIEVEVGDLIEPHLYIPRRRGYIFRGWSYDQKHLEEVKPEDRIYSNTTLYAIWKRAEEERVEEPEEIKGEDHKAYIFGYPNGTVRPNGSITRAEAAAMLARLLNIEAIGSAAKPNFTDTESSWYNKAINAVVFRGIMKGYPDGRFRPNAPITRAEFTQMISTIDNKPYGVAPFADVPGHWAERAIGSEYQAKRITGYPDGLFRPDANITRAEAAVILNKIFERKYDNLSLLKCKNPQMIKRFIDLDESFWGYNDMVEATNSHEYVRRYKEDVMKRLEEDWLLIK